MGLKAVASKAFVAVDLVDTAKTYSFAIPTGSVEFDELLNGKWKDATNTVVISSSGLTLNNTAASYIAENEGVYTLIVNNVEYTMEATEDGMKITDVYEATNFTVSFAVVFSADYIGTWRDAANVEIVIAEESVKYDGKTASSLGWDRDSATGAISYYTFTITEGEGEEAVSTTYKISNIDVEEDVALFGEEELAVKSGSFDLTVGEEEAVEFFWQHFASNTAQNKPNTAIVNAYASGVYKYFQGVYTGNGYSLIAMPKEVIVVMDGVHHRANAITYLGDEASDEYGFVDSYASVTAYEFYINNRSVRVDLILGSNSSTDNGALVTFYNAENNTQIGQTRQLNRYTASVERDAAFVGSFYTDAIVTGEGEAATTTSYIFSVHNTSTNASSVTYTSMVLDDKNGTRNTATMSLPHPIYGDNNAIIGYGFYQGSTDYTKLYTIVKDGEGNYTLTVPGGQSYSVTKFAGFDEKYYGTWVGFKQGSNSYNLIINQEGASLLRTSNNAKYFVYAVAPRAEGGYWFMNSVGSSYKDCYLYIDEDGVFNARYNNADYTGDNALVKYVPMNIDANYIGTWKGNDADGNEHTVTITSNTITVSFYDWYLYRSIRTATLNEFVIKVLADGGYKSEKVNNYYDITWVYNAETQKLNMTIVQGNKTVEIELTKQAAEA